MEEKYDGHFVLLKDFEHAYDNFEWKVIDIDGELQRRVLGPMEQLVNDSVREFTSFDLKGLRELTRDAVDSGYYVATLDGGAYFNAADFSFEITRACWRIEHAHDGPLYRLPRVGTGLQLVQQGMNLRQRYQSMGQGRPIALCDDGIGSGRSLEQVVNILRDLHLEVHKIVVLLNPRRLTHIRDIDVQTLLPIEGEHIWLSERDLYWGLPRSGLSFTRADELKPIFGIPYTIDIGLVERRIEVTGSAAGRLREGNLRLNVAFWEYLEHQLNQRLTMEDCGRISFLADVLGMNDQRVADVISSINRPEFRLVEVDADAV